MLAGDKQVRQLGCGIVERVDGNVFGKDDVATVGRANPVRAHIILEAAKAKLLYGFYHRTFGNAAFASD